LIPRVLRKLVDDGATGTLVESASNVENAFPGGREVIRESFKDRLVPSAAIPQLFSLLYQKLSSNILTLYALGGNLPASSNASLFTIRRPSIRILGSRITQHLLLFKPEHYEIGDFFNFS